MYDPNAEKVFRWYDAGEWWGYKVGVVAYSNGLVIAHNPVGLTDEKMQLTKLKSGTQAEQFAQKVKQAFEVVQSHLSLQDYQDSSELKKMLRGAN